MKRLFAMLPVAAFLAGCLDQKPLSPEEFSAVFADRLRSKEPSLQIEAKPPLQLQLANAQKRDYAVFLYNAYSEYKLDPSRVDDVLDRFTNATLEAFRAGGAPIDLAKIVPVIKDREFLEETKRSLAARGVDTGKFDQYSEEYNDQLIIMYGIDSAKNIKYLQQADLRKLKLDSATLRSLALKNLMSILPGIQLHGSDGTYMVTAGGTYEASVLLVDTIWQSDQFKVNGEIVVAVPARDMLLVTGSKDAKGLRSVREIVAKTMQGGSYQLTSQLFVYRNNKFIAFNE
jgi:uncharacterized protein YtpQ (UPF0354 family)